MCVCVCVGIYICVCVCVCVFEVHSMNKVNIAYVNAIEYSFTVAPFKKKSLVMVL